MRGPVAADGSPVELYARLRPMGEPELIHAALPPGAHILELGCGAGRMTHRLLELGHPVTAVDNSAEMLAHVRGAETVLADIAELALGRRFDAVLLASQLINVADDRLRARFLTACASHVAPDGVVLVQRYDPAWAAAPAASESPRDGLRISVCEPRRDGPYLTASVEYELDGRRWRHGPFTSRILTDDELATRLDVAGLRGERWLDERGTWLAARAMGDTSALFVPVPAAEPLVAEHRVRWDGAAAAGIPAHVTVLFPFLDPDLIDARTGAELRSLIGASTPFEVRFARVGRFPTVLWLAPEPAERFTALTAAIFGRWPKHPPYAGAFDEVIPHLTVADGAPPELLGELERALAAGLPLVTRVEEVMLTVRRSGAWATAARFRLGAAA